MPKEKIDLGKSPVVKTFINYAIPSVLGMVTLSLAGIVDGLFIGRYVGTDALAGVSIVYPITSLAIGFAIMIGTGGTTTASAEIGAGNIAAARNTFTVTSILVTVAATLFMILGIIFAAPLSEFFGIKGGLEDEIRTYMTPLLLFFIPFMHAWILDVFIRNDGRPVFPSITLVISSVINIILDYLFIVRFGWGLRGAAFATGLSQIVPMVVFWIYICRGNTSYKLVRPVFKSRKIAHMLYNGVSEFINEFSVGLSTILFNMALITRIGSIGVASYSIIQYMTMITLMVFFGIAQAVQPGLSYNLGVGDRDRIRAFKRIALQTNIVISVLSLSILVLFSESIASLFTRGDADVIALTSQITKYYSWSFLPMGMNITISMYFTSIHYARESAITALSRSFVLFVFFLYTLPLIFGDIGLWLTVPLAELVTLGIVAVLSLRRPLDDAYLKKTINRLQESHE